MSQKTLVKDLKKMIEFADSGTVSKTILDEPFGKVVLFSMAAGQALSEHTASMPALVEILEGKGEFILGKKQESVQPGSWIYLPKNLKHSVKAQENLVFLLTLFRT